MVKKIESKSRLDNTSRYWYPTVRSTEGELESIEFEHKGTVWRADTLAEAVALRNDLVADEVFVPEHETMD